MNIYLPKRSLKFWANKWKNGNGDKLHCPKIQKWQIRYTVPDVMLQADNLRQHHLVRKGYEPRLAILAVIFSFGVKWVWDSYIMARLKHVYVRLINNWVALKQPCRSFNKWVIVIFVHLNSWITRLFIF